MRKVTYIELSSELLREAIRNLGGELVIPPDAEFVDASARMSDGMVRLWFTSDEVVAVGEGVGGMRWVKP